MINLLEIVIGVISVGARPGLCVPEAAPSALQASHVDGKQAGGGGSECAVYVASIDCAAT